MFSFLKQKIEIKPNIRLMHSIQNKSFKVGGEIIVPDNFVCLIFHNSKFYTELEAGSHVVERELCPKLFKKQFKAKGKNKRIALICHYINLTPKSLCFKHRHKEIFIDYELTSFKDFAEFILLYTYKTDDCYTEECLRDFVLSNIKILSNSNLEILNSIFSRIGIKLNNVKTTDILKVKPKDELDLLNTTNQSQQSYSHTQSNAHSPVDPIQPAPTNPTPSSQQGYTCPNCNAHIKFTTTYCIRCGYKLK